MQQEYKANVERHPRHIEEGNRSGASHERADGVNVAHRLQRFRARPAIKRQPQDGIVCLRRQLPVNAACEPDENLSANDFERALENIESDGQRRERNECWDAAARKHPVIDLEHVE